MNELSVEKLKCANETSAERLKFAEERLKWTEEKQHFMVEIQNERLQNKMNQEIQKRSPPDKH